MQFIEQDRSAGTTGDRSDAHRDRSRAWSARLLGALFIAGFLFYGVGFGLVSSVIGTQDFIATLPQFRNVLAFGAFLMLLNTAVDVGKGVLFFPILEQHGRRTALVYLAALIVQVVLLDIGALCLLALVPLSQFAAEAGATSAAWVSALASTLTDSNTMAYNIGQATLCFGGIFLSALLYRTALVPRLLAGLGIAGYALHAVGSIAEIFGVHISMILLIPGGLFEVILAFWLIIKGFAPETHTVEGRTSLHSAPTEAVVLPAM